MTIRICNMISKIQNTKFWIIQYTPCDNLRQLSFYTATTILKFTHNAITQIWNVTTSINKTAKLYKTRTKIYTTLQSKFTIWWLKTSFYVYNFTGGVEKSSPHIYLEIHVHVSAKCFFVFVDRIWVFQTGSNLYIIHVFSFRRHSP